MSSFYFAECFNQCSGFRSGSPRIRNYLVLKDPDLDPPLLYPNMGNKFKHNIIVSFAIVSVIINIIIRMVNIANK